MHCGITPLRGVSQRMRHTAAVVHISSDPAGAMVFYSDAMIGETSMDTTIDPRRGDYSMYTIRVVKEKYKPSRRGSSSRNSSINNR